MSEEPTCCHNQRTAVRKSRLGLPAGTWFSLQEGWRCVTGWGGGWGSVCDAGDSEEQELEHAKINQSLSM